MFARFKKCDSGATAIEYGLLVALLSLGIVAAVTGVRDNLNGVFETLSRKLTSL